MNRVRRPELHIALLWLLGAGCACGQSTGQAVGFVTAAQGTHLIAAGTQTPLRARAGDILFPGDTLSLGAGGSASLYYCPQTSGAIATSYSVNRNVVIGDAPGGLPGLTGSPAGICLIPPFERSPETATVRSPGEILPNPPGMDVVRQQIQSLEPAARAPLELLAQQDLHDPRLRLAFAVLLERAGLLDEAVGQYLELARQWPDQPRILKYAERVWASRGTARAILHPEPTPRSATGSGKTYALVIGISTYDQRDRFPDLPFASRDAASFVKYLVTDRGGVSAPMVLQDQAATSGAIRNYFNALKTKAGKNDSIIVFVAAHGDMLHNIPSLITRRADPQDPSINSLPLSELQDLMLGRTSPVKRAMMFLDLCHSGHAARFELPAGKAETPYLLMTATNESKNALAFEDEIFDRGHGAFTYFLLRGLNTGEAPLMLGMVSDSISAAALKTYVETRVAYATAGRQSPTTALGIDPEEEIANLKKAGMPFDTTDVAALRIPFSLRAGRSRGRAEIEPAGTAPNFGAGPSDLARRIELEDEGEEILLTYLKGDETAQTRDDFARGARVFRDALAIQPGAPYLMARADFCEGRTLVFEKEYDRAIPLLENSIRLDPPAAYGYNALGIAYLERANYPLAIAAFQDAIRRAPNWAYPRHNLALAHTQTGAYPAAVAEYRKAIELAPHYSYLHYNLGLIFQKIHRTRDAEREYLEARSLADDRAAPLIALGVLMAGEGRRRIAERYYREALGLLEKSPDPANLLNARQNLAALLAKKRNRFAEAERLWDANIQAGYLPSRISYAEALLSAAAKDRPDAMAAAIEQYRAVVQANPEQIAIRLRLAEQLEKSGQLEDAQLELMEAECRRPKDPVIYERLGAIQERMSKPAEAGRSYDRALGYSSDPEQRRRLLAMKKRCRCGS
ncbi:MAG: tetratricopeptide repeat protein [Bryobacteraceae bacterium]